MYQSSRAILALAALAVVAACAPRPAPIQYDPIPGPIISDVPQGKYGKYR